MKITQTDFKQFKKEYDEFRELFGLMHWKVYFRQERLTDAFAESYFGNTYTVTVTLPLEWDAEQRIEDKAAQIRSTARHEALHLFTASLTNVAYSRYVTRDEVESAVEETQRLLEAFFDKWGHV